MQSNKRGHERKAAIFPHSANELFPYVQALYIALILSHWGWYSPGWVSAFATLVPLFSIYLFFTPLILHNFLFVLTLGRPDAHAFSATVEFMEHQDMALKQLAEVSPFIPRL